MSNTLRVALYGIVISLLGSKISQAAAPYPITSKTRDLVPRAFAAQPDVNCTKCFHVINLFSFDQKIAIQSKAPYNTRSEVPHSFVQFFLDDPGQAQNGGALIGWNPNYDDANATKQEPPLQRPEELEFEPAEKDELIKWNGSGDFVASVTHSFKDVASGEDRVRQANLVINSQTSLGPNNGWNCQYGSCRFDGAPYLWYPIYYCECLPVELQDCCSNKNLNPTGRPKPPPNSYIAKH